MRDTYSKEIEFLLKASNELGIELTRSQGELLLRHLELVGEKNRVVNLTRITDVHEGVIKHSIDSLLFLKSTPFEWNSDEVRFVDIGTGAGFPGIPITVVTRWNGLLIDSVGKKGAAVAEFIDELGIDHAKAEVIRAEELALDKNNRYELVVARAVADISVLMEYAAPLLMLHGYLCVSKGIPTDDELRAACKVAPLCGFESVSRETYLLPDECGERNIFLFRKTSEPKLNLPRRAGMATKRPLYKK